MIISVLMFNAGCLYRIRLKGNIEDTRQKKKEKPDINALVESIYSVFHINLRCVSPAIASLHWRVIHIEDLRSSENELP
jgi:hypothetical protein